MSSDPIEVLSSVLEMAKAWRAVNGPLTRVRNISESNEKALQRVCLDYAKVEDILSSHLTYKEKDRLHERWEGTLPAMLLELLVKYKEGDAKLKEENAQLAAKIDKARAHLSKIGEWDCLNPPKRELLDDLPWLRRLVDEALADLGSKDT